MPTHHPDAELLVDYAAGNLPEPQDLAIATHVGFCMYCRDAVERLETLGGELLETLEPAPLPDGAFEAVLDRIDAIPLEPRLAASTPPGVAKPPPEPASGVVVPELPRALSGHVHHPLSELTWQQHGGLEEVPVLPDQGPLKTRLLRLSGGSPLPLHASGRGELAVVLRGGFTDDTGHYESGDFAIDDGIDHHPVADRDGGCVCLMVDTPSKRKSRKTRR